MPVYIFKCDGCGSYVEEQRPMSDSQKPKTCDCGETMARDYTAEQRGVISTPGNWPMASDAAGVGVGQAMEAMKHAASIGIPTQFDNEGRAIFTSPGHRKKYCEAIGMFDRNAGYSDPQRRLHG